MNYRPISSRNKNSGFKPLLIAVICIGVFVLLDMFVFKGANAVVQEVGAPTWKANNASLGVFSNITSYFSSKSNLTAENNRLIEQNELMRLEVLNTRMLETENEELKKQLGRGTSTKKQILGVVLLKPSFSPFDTFVIDVGHDVEIAVDDTVMVAGVPIGKIAEVYSNTSLVRLYSSPGQEFQVYIGNNGIEALAKGLGGNNFFVVLPRETKVKEGDLISIPSIYANTFGVVNKIDISETESFQRVFFRNPVNMHEVKWVEVQK